MTLTRTHAQRLPLDLIPLRARVVVRVGTDLFASVVTIVALLSDGVHQVDRDKVGGCGATPVDHGQREISRGITDRAPDVDQLEAFAQQVVDLIGR